jgi:hypothetical protein
MAISSVSSTNPLDQLAQSLVSRFDANKDGQLTTDEFASFLTNFLSSVSSGNASALGVGTTAAASAPKARLEGFDAAKLADLSHKSIKYQFGRVAQNYSLAGVTDKASAEAVLNSMTSDLLAAGVNVLQVKGDSIQIKDDAGQDAWIDVIHGANSGNPAWQWLDTRF